MKEFSMKRLVIIYFVLAALAAPSVSAQLDGVRDLTWEDLLPEEQAPFDDPFAELTRDQLGMLGVVARVRRLIDAGKMAPDGAEANEAARLTAELTAEGIDVEWLFSQRERVAAERRKRAEAVGSSVDGLKIRLPGYMLPIAFAEDRVTGFLLVPWVGACIHTPPPPPNQMVHVAVPDGAEHRNRFAPIWIEGEIRLQPDSYLLFLVDGSRDINVAYTMTTDKISDYSAGTSGVLAQVEIPEGIGSEHSWLQKWQAKTELLFTKAMTDIQQARSSGPMLWGLLVAFLYGILHTLGPGHGKTVVAAYFVGERGSLWRGLRMGGQIALFHVLSAVIAVVITDFAVRQTTGQAPSDYRIVRLVSYASIIAIGGWMLIKAVKAARTSHDELHHHHEGCGCARHAAPAKGLSGMLSLAVGAVPCTGALLVLLFGLANDLLWSSIALVAAISLGMALALSGIGIAAILGRRFLDRRAGTDEVRLHRMATSLRIGAAVGVLLIGCLLFAGSWPEGRSLAFSERRSSYGDQLTDEAYLRPDRDPKGLARGVL